MSTRREVKQVVTATQQANFRMYLYTYRQVKAHCRSIYCAGAIAGLHSMYAEGAGTQCHPGSLESVDCSTGLEYWPEILECLKLL